MKQSALQAQWRRRLLDSGFHDIEAPSGIISSRLDHQRPDVAEHLECARVFLHAHVFRSAWEHEVWSLHCDDVSNREICRRLGIGRKGVDRTVTALTALMLDGLRPKKRRPGRPRDPSSLRSEGMRFEARLSQDAALALDHISAALEVSKNEAMRISLVTVARELHAVPKSRSQCG